MQRPVEFNLHDFGFPFQTSAPRRRVSKRRRGDLFVKGPIPWAWLSAAAQLPGKTLHVAVALWLLAGLGRSCEIQLQGKRLREMGVSRHSAYRALKRLQEAGLITVRRHRGRAPVVELLG